MKILRIKVRVKQLECKEWLIYAVTYTMVIPEIISIL